ncbi:hypothetical protein AB0F93_00540 [Micromonospora tulbaghiae]|uniref:hypothetical protein n=1 Tax=Micromonospora tulbaghiae TaxID=479978 RepID=UPI00332C8128
MTATMVRPVPVALTPTPTYTYTWVSGDEWCSREHHKRSSTCPDCESNGVCAACGLPVPDGPDHLVCTDNGATIHADCDPQRAADRWLDCY